MICLKCRQEIRGGGTIFCPFCGEYQAPNGWYSSSHAADWHIDTGIVEQSDRRTPYSRMFEIEETILDVLLEGDFIVVKTSRDIRAYDLKRSVADNRLATNWNFPFPNLTQRAAIALLRPFIFIWEEGRLDRIRIDVGENHRIKVLDCRAESVIIRPFEYEQVGERHAFLVLASEERAWIVYANPCGDIETKGFTIGHAGFLIGASIDKTEDGALTRLFTSEGATVRINYPECTESRDYAPETVDQKAALQERQGDKAERASSFSLSGELWLVRSTDGSSRLLRTGVGPTVEIVLASPPVTNDPPSIGRSLSSILFTSQPTKNLLVGYNWRDNQSIKTDLILGQIRDDFRLRPNRLVACTGFFWGVFPSTESGAHYRVAGFPPSLNGAVVPTLLAPLSSPRTIQGTENLQFAMNREYLVSFTRCYLMVLTKI
ncbi:MAG: hypothetical protein PHI34_05755 [Acidobacteriota bacterium]|nr:hypothetical protein [Acidobacteriota bacterium]